MIRYNFMFDYRNTERTEPATFVPSAAALIFNGWPFLSASAELLTRRASGELIHGYVDTNGDTVPFSRTVARVPVKLRLPEFR